MFVPWPTGAAASPSSFSAVASVGQLELESFGGPDGAVAASRSGALYGVHAYHTKVPAEAIASFVLANTKLGDVVLDPFCGSGMTGVAAAMTGRNAVLNDLSPAAVHIAANYTTPCEPEAFERAVEDVLERVGSKIRALYATRHSGRAATIEYLVWSDVRRCPGCGKDVLLWDHRTSGLRIVTCSRCGYETSKTAMPVVGEKPVEANLNLGAGRQRVVRGVTPDDLRPDVDLAALPWYPSADFDSRRPMWRRGHDDLGIRTVADFYSPRNLSALSLLWDAASRESDDRIRSALRFSLTAIVNRASRRYQWNAKRPTNVLGGTLYVSSLRYEWNVLSLWLRKTRAVARLFRSGVSVANAVETHRGSATDLSIGDESIDYCFTDPPFGSHIVYSDASLLWEAWLDDLTDRESEAIVVRNGDHAKSVSDYGDLLCASFGEIRRVLKPHGNATVVFQASDPNTWSTVYNAARRAGLSFADATTLSKGQPSFKQVKGQQAGEMVAQTDVVLTFSRKTGRRLAPSINLKEAVHAAITARGDAGRDVSAGAIFGDVNARLLRGFAEPVGIREVNDALAA
jgi:DNA modification methylase/ribosomal protein S27AE